LKKLEGIVEAMESDDLPLETLLAKYEEGSKLVKICQEKLADAEFTVPADFTKRDLPKPGMMKMGQMKAAPAPAAGASPAQ